MKVYEADKWFSKCVRLRARWRCERCGTMYGPHLQGLDCHHLITRDNWAVRFEPMNGVALCTHCHRAWAEGYPFEVVEWAKNDVGVDVDMLVELSHNIVRAKEARHSKPLISKHYHMQYVLMEKKSEMGIHGRLVFTGW